MFGVDVFNYGAIFNAHQQQNVKKTYRSETNDLLQGYSLVSANLQDILYKECGGDEGRASANNCSTGPFTRFNVRGKEGRVFNEEKWRFATPNKLELYNHDGAGKSGGAWIKMRSGYIADFTIHIQTDGEYKFHEEWLKMNTDSVGVIDFGTGNTMENADGKSDTWIRVLMVGDTGDELQVDIDGDWSGISRFKLKVNGTNLIDENSKSIDDEVFIILNNVYEEQSASCESGYTLDEDVNSDTYGLCVKDGAEDNTLLYVGIGGATLLLLYATMK